MDPRHGPPYSFTERFYPGFGVLAQPIVYVRLRVPESHSWSLPIAALVDTGATVTLIEEDFAHGIPGFETSSLGRELQRASGTGLAGCRSAHFDLRLGSDDPRAPVLTRCPIHVTQAALPRPVLLGQRGVLDSFRLVHSNCGAKRYFRFVHPE
jgi:hypothetical protein